MTRREDRDLLHPGTILIEKTLQLPMSLTPGKDIAGGGGQAQSAPYPKGPGVRVYNMKGSERRDRVGTRYHAMQIESCVRKAESRGI